jgi:hypothetical protein
MEWLGFALALAGGVGSAVVLNRMVGLRVLTAHAWSDLDVLLKQRREAKETPAAAGALQDAIGRYNAAVHEHNHYLQKFPNNMLAQVLSYSLKKTYQDEDGAGGISG